MNNGQFAESDKEFQEACKRAGIPPSRRQASKYRLKFGKAWQHRNGRPIDSETQFAINAK